MLSRNAPRRITFIATAHGRAATRWRDGHRGSRRLVFADSFATLRFVLQRGMDEAKLDIERFIVDGAATHADFLALLSTVPEDFAGDLLFVANEGESFLSACGRGGGRVLYALSADDVRFYFEANDLVADRCGFASQLSA